MKTIIRILIVSIFSLASECGAPFAYVDNTRLVVEGTLRLSSGQLAVNKQVTMYSDGNVMNTTTSDQNGRFNITSPGTNKGFTLYFSSYRIGTVSNYPEFSNDSKISNFTKGYYDLGTIELIPLN